MADVVDELVRGQAGSAIQTCRAPDSLVEGHLSSDAQILAALDDLPPGHTPPAFQSTAAGGSLTEGHWRSDLHRRSAPGDLDGDHPPGVDRIGTVAVKDQQQPSTVGRLRVEAQCPHADADALLLILADALDDIERTRIANENRLRSLTTVKGVLGVSKAAVQLDEIVTVLTEVEKRSTRALERAMREHPLGPWVERTTGIGLKQGARLIAAIGDPYIRSATVDENGEVIEEARPRGGPAELWAYCGYAPEQKRRKGVKSNWNAQAKMRAYLVAESCIKQRTSPYRAVYDEARANWAERDTSDGHRHNHALRLVAKAVLKDLYLEARALAR